MAWSTFTPTADQNPDWGYVAAEEPRVVRSAFGDGYTQRLLDGVNTIKRSVELSWTNISESDAEGILDFFRARNGVTPFLYTLPHTDDELTWVCTKWSVQPVSNLFVAVKATFVQEFDVAP